jgi:hypothetical protein
MFDWRLDGYIEFAMEYSLKYELDCHLQLQQRIRNVEYAVWLESNNLVHYF